MQTYGCLVLIVLCTKLAWLLIQLLIAAWFHLRDRRAQKVQIQSPRLPKSPKSSRSRGLKLEIRLELNW